MTVAKKLSLLLPLPGWTMICLLIFWLVPSTDAKMLSLEDMHLKRDKKDSELPIEVLKRSDDPAGFLGVIEGYDLSHLQPYADLFAEEHHIPSSDRTNITDTRTNEVFAVPIYRATYDDGSIILAEKDEHGNIVYVELRRPRGEPDMFLIPSESNSHLSDDEAIHQEDSEFLAFTEDDVDYEQLQSQFHYAEVNSPEDQDRRLRRSKANSDQEEPLVPSFDYRNGRESFQASSSFSSSSFASALAKGCDSYRVVKLAVVFDAEFCAMYGTFAASARRIMTIVASASFHYERDMCVRIKLTDIYSPETSCSGSDSVFRKYKRQIPCGRNDSFLAKFSSLMKKERKSIRLDKDATIHMFSGYPPPDGTIGCAYVGSFCHNEYTYGVEYMSFARNPHSQGVVLAHEIGHVLNAPHLLLFTNSHVMEPNINNAADGFHMLSIHSILSFLNSDDITCDSVIQNTDFRAPTETPTMMPTMAPTITPTMNPTSSPKLRTASSRPHDNGRCSIIQDKVRQPKCIFASNNEGGYACFNSSSLLDAGATTRCLFPVPIKRILRCDGPLRTGRVLTRGNSGTLDKFEASSCDFSCVVVSNFVCFRVGGKEKVHSITYDAFADVDVFGTFQTEVEVRDKNGSADCEVAATSCVS